MEENYYNPDYYKKKIIPKIEDKIIKEINDFVDQEISSKNLQGATSREELFEKTLNSFYKALGSTSIAQFFENEYNNVVNVFQKHFPYNSIDDLINSNLKQIKQSFNRKSLE